MRIKVCGMRVLFVLGLVTALGVWAQEVTGDWRARLVEVAMEQTKEVVSYDPAYVRIPYPGGDVPAGTGVCTDVVIRAYRRAFQYDLQKAVH
jgi:uncharacterized protein YijF (DUF1287 family)